MATSNSNTQQRMADRVQQFEMHPVNTISSILNTIFMTLYSIYQIIIIKLFSPAPPRINDPLLGPRIAIIGAGLTGVSAASHCVSHGSDVVIFESSEQVGGIWSRVNTTSGLQIHSMMYRFHPSVNYTSGYPRRDDIVPTAAITPSNLPSAGSLLITQPFLSQSTDVTRVLNRVFFSSPYVRHTLRISATMSSRLG